MLDPSVSWQNVGKSDHFWSMEHAKFDEICPWAAAWVWGRGQPLWWPALAPGQWQVIQMVDPMFVHYNFLTHLVLQVRITIYKYGYIPSIPSIPSMIAMYKVN